jgi:ABC-type antimicrobial peptide transport system permease subunit
LKQGRLLDSHDDTATPAILINEALARKYYPGETPIGKLVYLGAPDNRLFDRAPIVGVVADTRDAGLGVDALPTVYIPRALMPGWPFFSFVIRTSGDPLSVVASTRRIIHELDPNLPVQNVRTLDDVLQTAIAPARWSTTLVGVFAGVALVMAVLGVFGVLSYLVTHRTRELGIRIALGASTRAVRRDVVMRGLRLAGAGLALGVAGALLLTRYMATLLYGVTPTDPIAFGAVALVLVSAAALASYLPARRATRVDPIIALRVE